MQSSEFTALLLWVSAASETGQRKKKKKDPVGWATPRVIFLLKEILAAQYYQLGVLPNRLATHV